MDYPKRLQQDYRKVFKGLSADEVLADLRDFCHATKTTAGRTESQERLEGRREVFLRIMSILKIDISEWYSYVPDDIDDIDKTFRS